MATPKDKKTAAEGSSTPKLEVFRPVSELLSSESADKRVKVYVGSKRKRWVLDEDLLCERSVYFRNAFQGGFMEATEKEMYLQEEDAEAFAMFVDWIYGSPLTCKSGSDAPSGLKSLKLYCLAEFLGIETLQNLAIDLYSAKLKGYHTTPSLSHIAYGYNHSPQNSYARKFIANSVAYHLSLYEVSKDTHDAPLREHPEFAFDVVKAMHFYQFCTPQQRKWPWNEPPCNYHLHRHTKKCG